MAHVAEAETERAQALVETERHGPVLRLTLRNPPANALSVAAMKSLQEELDRVRNDGSVRAVIIAATALECGLGNRVVPGKSLTDAVRELADTIAAKSPAAVKLGKQAVYEEVAMGLADAYDHASRVMVENMLAPDAEEGINAFLER